MNFAYPLTKPYISLTFYEIFPGVKVIGCGHSIYGSNFRRRPWIGMVELYVSHIIYLRLMIDKIKWKSFLGKIVMGRTWNSMLIPLPSTVTLTLSLHGWVMGFVHFRTEVSIFSKCYENPSRGWGDMEHKRHLRPNFITCNCQIDLKFA